MAEGRGDDCQNCHIWGPLRDLLLVTGFLLGLLAGFAFFVYYYEEHFSVKLRGSRLEKSDEFVSPEEYAVQLEGSS
jgi:hypothetical protein